MRNITHIIGGMRHYEENPYVLLETQAKEAGISIDKLCEEAGIWRSTFTYGKKGKHSPNYSTIQKFNKALDKLKSEKVNNN